MHFLLRICPFHSSGAIGGRVNPTWLPNSLCNWPLTCKGWRSKEHKSPVLRRVFAPKNLKEFLGGLNQEIHYSLLCSVLCLPNQMRVYCRWNIFGFLLHYNSVVELVRTTEAVKHFLCSTKVIFPNSGIHGGARVPRQQAGFGDGKFHLPL